jgi:hypothetical protein
MRPRLAGARKSLRAGAVLRAMGAQTAWVVLIRFVVVFGADGWRQGVAESLRASRPSRPRDACDVVGLPYRSMLPISGGTS